MKPFRGKAGADIRRRDGLRRAAFCRILHRFESRFLVLGFGVGSVVRWRSCPLVNDTKQVIPQQGEGMFPRRENVIVLPLRPGSGAPSACSRYVIPTELFFLVGCLAAVVIGQKSGGGVVSEETSFPLA